MFINAIDLKNKEALKIWEYVEKFVELDKLGEKSGNELDVFFSAKFLESFDQVKKKTSFLYHFLKQRFFIVKKTLTAM